MSKVKMNLGGRPVEVEKMDFVPIAEQWSTYRLEDGTIFKMKLIVSDVFKLPTPDPVTGFPQLMVRSSSVMSVEPLETEPSKKGVQ
jgi:hypothetical protein